MTLLETLWSPLRLTGFFAWGLSCALASWLLVRSNAQTRRRVGRLAATYLVVGGLSIVVTAVFGQHYSYTDVIMNDALLGFDVDFFVRHVGIAVLAAWRRCQQDSLRLRTRQWLIVAGVVAGELIVRADNTALLVLLAPFLREGGLAGAVLPPIAGAIGLIVVSSRIGPVEAAAGPRGA